MIVTDVYPYLKNDIGALLGIYKYESPVIFIVGLPKSGTTWLHRMLLKIPGYNNRIVDDPCGVTVNHDICEEVFRSLPRYGYSVIKFHTRYTEDNIRILNAHVPKFIVMYRDLRDMCVSRYHHVMADPGHRHHRLYQEAGQDDGMTHCIDVIAQEYVAWVRDWVDALASLDGRAMTVRYEDLNRNPFDIMKRVLQFYRVEMSDDLVRSMVSGRIVKEKDLAAELKRDKGLKVGSTARKGAIGEWKHHFNETHKKQFKEAAGDLLVRLGYERDLQW